MPSHRIITIGQSIQLPTGDFTVVSYGAGNFRLRNELTGEYHLVEHIELGRMLPPGQSLDTSTPPKPEATLVEVLDGLDDDARFLIPHLQELVDG